MGRYYRNPKTMQEKRHAQEGGVRAKRNVRNLPNDWNDGPRMDQKDRSWKGNRKSQWKPKPVKEARKLTFTKFLAEVSLHSNDLAMQDYYDDQENPPEEPAPRGYAVGWEGQGFEWRGDKSPREGGGRYKYYMAGRIVAINIPTHAKAQQIADDLDSSYREGNFDDPSVYRTYGKDYDIVDYYGSFVKEMKELDERDLEVLVDHRTKDYSK
jgi:hypothetical protein